MKRRIAFLTLATLVAAGACSRRESPPVIENYSYSKPSEVVMKHLDLDLTLDFGRRVIAGTAAIDIENASESRVLHLDTWALRILDVTRDDGRDDGKPARFTLGDSVPLVGRPLSIRIEPETRRVTVRYETTSEARGVQWLSPAQTAGREHPYVYTQSQTLHARSWVPCQDNPAVRFTYTARVRVPAGLVALMSARNPKSKSADGAYEFEMKQPIPAYLLALAAGDIDYRPVSPRSGVYSEPGVVDAAAWEFADLERMIAAAESLYGPYRWEQFDVLVLPPSFPFGGMENPRLTFATPILVAGDRSLVSVIAHELAHSWSGNLVTNATWNDFWLNEGFTTYFERRIDETLYGREYMEMQTLLGRRDLDLEFEEKGADNKDTALYVDLQGRDPDEELGLTVYEKGYLFLRLLEETVGRERWDAFLRRYFDTHAFQTMTTDRFVAYLKKELLHDAAATIAELRVDEWVYKPGLPPNAPTPRSTRFEQVDAQVAAFVKGTPAAKLATKGWTSLEWQRFLDNLPAPLTTEQLDDLENTFHFGRANAEVQRSWFLQAIANGYEPAYPLLEEFLVGVGRRYLLRPVYMKLAETPAGMDFARRVYAKARPGYHSITVTGIDLVLKWNEVTRAEAAQ